MSESKSVTFKPEGVVNITTGPDGVTAIASDKPISTHIDQILSYGIENIADIRSYDVEQKEGKIFHHIVFNSGGTIELSFDPDGKNFNSSASGLSAEIIEGNRILIKVKRN